MRYFLVNGKDNPTFDSTQVMLEMRERGHEYLGNENGPHLRQELRGQPRFKGLCGPMWQDENTVRYETAEMNDILSK